MATIVNKNLKEQVKTQNTIDVYGYFFESEVKLFSYLASNKTQTDKFLNKMWNKFGKFANNAMVAVCSIMAIQSANLSSLSY